MSFRRKTRYSVKGLLLLLVIFLVGLIGLGCIQGLQPVGWSGGAVSGNTLFVGSLEGRLVAVNTVDTSRQWSDELKAEVKSGGFNLGCTLGGGGGAKVAIYGTPVVAGDLVYLGGYNGKVYAFNADSLGVRWVYPPDDYLRDKEKKVVPIIGGLATDLEKVYFGGSDGKVYALDATTGEEKWKFVTEDEDTIWSTPAVKDGTLYIGSFDKKLYAIDTETGKEKWRGPFKTEGVIVSTPVVYNNTVYFGSFDRHLYAVDIVNGKEIWKFPATDEAENNPGNWFWTKPVVYKDAVYAGNLDGEVYVLQADSGNKIAEFDLGSPVSSAPVMVADSIIFASRKGAVYNLDTRSNQIKQIADIEDEVYGPLAQSEGVIYIHTPNLVLHRINADTGAILMSISLKSTE
ncbi:PQQ-binding-like beta-propeller repeat protein [Chloroflexota bacterium]